MRGPILPRIDGNLSKSFHVTESKIVQLRIDAFNVMNLPLPATPNVNINGTGNTAFGQVVNKTGSRRFQVSLRLSFQGRLGPTSNCRVLKASPTLLCASSRMKNRKSHTSNVSGNLGVGSCVVDN